MADESQTSATNHAPPTAGSFDTFVSPHLAVLLRVAGSPCRNPHDAEDLVQDTLFRAFNGLATFDGTYPRAWLLTVMRNANINRHRRKRPGLLHDATDLSGEFDRRNPPAPSAEDVATARTQASWITMRSDVCPPGTYKWSNSSTSTASPTTKRPPRSASSRHCDEPPPPSPPQSARPSRTRSRLPERTSMNPRDALDMFRRKGGSRCIEIGRQIQTYLDDSLDLATAAKVSSHLHACRRCGLTADDYRHLKFGTRRHLGPNCG